MSLGNRQAQSGDLGSSFNFELAVLQTLKQIQIGISAISGGAGTTINAGPMGPIRATGSGNIPPNTYSFSVYNAGNANGVFNGAVIKPGEVLSWSAPTSVPFTNSIAYNATGTELVITYVA